MRFFSFLCDQPWAITEAWAQRMTEIYYVALERKARGEDFDKHALEKELGKPLDNTRTVDIRNGVAKIPIEGPIFRRADMFTEISGATTVETLAKDFNVALDDPAIKAIILYIDSPGGEVNGTNEFADMVYAARDKKPITGYIAHSGASGAYWIASATSEVVIDATASLGSIGVIAAVRDPNKENKKDIEFVSSQSPNKRPNPNTEAGKAQIQSFVDDLAQVFVDSVARNRNVSSETVVKDFGAGGLLVGQKAVDAGLADRVGSYESVLAELAADAQGVHASMKTKTRASLSDNGENTMSKEETKPGESRWDRFKAMFDDPDLGATTPLAASQPAQESAEVKELRLKAARAEKYEAAIKEARVKEAEAFAGSLVIGKVIMPASKAKVESLYVLHAQDDDASPLPAGSRVDRFKAMFEGLPKHQLTSEFIESQMPAGAMALNPDPGTEEEALKKTEESTRAWAAKQNPKLHLQEAK